MTRSVATVCIAVLVVIVITIQSLYEHLFPRCIRLRQGGFINSNGGHPLRRLYAYDDRVVWQIADPNIAIAAQVLHNRQDAMEPIIVPPVSAQMFPARYGRSGFQQHAVDIREPEAQTRNDC
jgi:hypothetical protein